MWHLVLIAVCAAAVAALTGGLIDLGESRKSRQGAVEIRAQRFIKRHAEVTAANTRYLLIKDRKPRDVEFELLMGCLAFAQQSEGALDLAVIEQIVGPADRVVALLDSRLHLYGYDSGHGRSYAVLRVDANQRATSIGFNNAAAIDGQLANGQYPTAEDAK